MNIPQDIYLWDVHLPGWISCLITIEKGKMSFILFFISHKLSCTFTAQILGRVVLIFSVLTKLNFGFCSYHITKTALLWEMMQWTYFHSPIPGSPINIWHCWSILSFFKLFPPLSSMIPGNLFLWCVFGCFFSSSIQVTVLFSCRCVRLFCYLHGL